MQGYGIESTLTAKSGTTHSTRVGPVLLAFGIGYTHHEHPPPSQSALALKPAVFKPGPLASHSLPGGEGAKLTT